MYGKKTNTQLPELYHLILWKGYLEKKSTWKPSVAVMHLRKLINTFDKKYLEKPIVTFLSLDSAPPMAKSTILKE